MQKVKEEPKIEIEYICEGTAYAFNGKLKESVLVIQESGHRIKDIKHSVAMSEDSSSRTKTFSALIIFYEVEK